MVKYVLTTNNIPREKFKTYTSYYYTNYLIPVNSDYKLYNMPYYNNSSYQFRNIYEHSGLKMLLANNIINKPTSNKSYNVGCYYIPNLPKGELISNEILPIKVEKFNIISNKYKITAIDVYSKINDKTFNPSLILTKGFSKQKILELEFIAFSVDKLQDTYHYTYFPRYEVHINLNDYYNIDITDFKQTNNYPHNLSIVYEYV